MTTSSSHEGCEECPDCDGDGRFQQDDGLYMKWDCPKCEGTGEVYNG